MKHLQTFSIFESTQNLTPEQVEFLDEYTDGTWSVNPSTGLVDVEGDFDCSLEELKNFKGVKFGRVSGTFDCFQNSLQTLEGAPQTVGGSFSSDDVKFPKGGWTVPNLVKQYSKSRGKKKDLLGTLVSPEVLQRRIDQNPEKMIILTKDNLKEILATPGYENLKFPPGLQPEIDLLSDLSGVGL